MDSSQADAARGADPMLSDSARRAWMKLARLSDEERTSHALIAISNSKLSDDTKTKLWKPLATALSQSSASETTLESFVTWLLQSERSRTLPLDLLRNPPTIAKIVQLLSIGPFVIDMLESQGDISSFLNALDHDLQATDTIELIRSEVSPLRDSKQISKQLRSIHRRETLRIAYDLFAVSNDTLGALQHWTSLADALISTAFDFAWSSTAELVGRPLLPNGQVARSGLIAFHRYGAGQIGFGDELDVMFLAETPGRTDNSRLISNIDFFDRVAHTLKEVLTSDDLGPPIYRLRCIKPEPERSAREFVDAAFAFQHYDLKGRTWERQLFVRARPVHPSNSLEQSFLDSLQSWVYRRYLGEPDIAGLGANQRKLQRRLEHEALHRCGAVDESQAAEDIEQTVLFLQLLYGHEHSSIRRGNVVAALQELAQKKLISRADSQMLTENYLAFRNMEIRRSFHGKNDFTLPIAEKRSLAEWIELVRRIVQVRLREAFPETQRIAEETDLILDPNPDPAWRDRLLRQYQFQRPDLAYQYLREMSEEEVSVLSTRKCRHFLSKIAQALLRAIGSTPDPDRTLANLVRMSESLGGKGVLWELLAGSPATLELILRLCSSGEYLVGLLAHTPGMIDELMDSLLIDRLPNRDELEVILEELCRQAENSDPFLESFKRSMHLRVGVRDILAKDSIVDTHRALSDIAEVCVRRILHEEYEKLEQQYGTPMRSDGIPSAYALIGLGKLGGQEPNYHSDLSVVLLFDRDGQTSHEKSDRALLTTTCRHFYEQLAQRLMRRCNQMGRHGRLFDLDVRFGPLGRSGVLAMELIPFIEFFRTQSAMTLDRLSLCRARPIAGLPEFCRFAMRLIVDLLGEGRFTESDRKQLNDYRTSLRQNASIHNLKRGVGGTMDVECLVQSLQLTHAHATQEILVPSTLEAIRAIAKNDFLSQEDSSTLSEGYLTMREVESGLRLMNTTARHDLPESKQGLDSLAYLLDWESGQQIHDRIQEIRTFNRKLLKRFFGID